jgi:hypothetical protein
VTIGLLAAHITWNILGATQDFSIFAGVLAGVVFLAINDYTKVGQRRSPPTNRQLPLMVGAFFSFVVASFLFGVLHGEADQSPSTYAEAICPSVVLAIGVVQLAVSLAVGLDEKSGARGAADSVAYATILIAVVFLTGVVVSPFFQALPQTNPPFNLDPWWLWVGSIGLITIPTLVVKILPVLGRGHATGWQTRLSTVKPYIQIQVSIGIGVAAAVVQNVMTSTVLPIYSGWIGPTSLAAVLIVVGMPIAALALEVGGSWSGGISSAWIVMGKLVRGALTFVIYGSWPGGGTRPLR